MSNFQTNSHSHIVDLDDKISVPAMLRAIVSEELQKNREILVQHLEQSFRECLSTTGSLRKDGLPSPRISRQLNGVMPSTKTERSDSHRAEHVPDLASTQISADLLKTGCESGRIALGSDSVQISNLGEVGDASRSIHSRHSPHPCMFGAGESQSTSNPPQCLSHVQPGMNERFSTRIVNHIYFEVVCGLLILSNVVVMAVEMQYKGIDVGFDIGAPGYTRPAAEVWPGAATVFDVLGIAFLCIFCIELILRIVAAGPRAARSNWLWFDGFLVLAALFDLAFAHLIALNPSMMRLLRLLRLARMVRLAKSMGGLQALFLILKSIEESIGALIWSFTVLFFMQLAVGMAVNQVLMTWMIDEDNDIDARRRVFAYFGTFSKTIMSMFEITLSNWVTSCRILMVDVGEGWSLFYIIYQCMICFATLKVITAVFIAQTNRAVARDDDLVTLMEEEQRQLMKVKLQEMFAGLDASHDGQLSWDEFEAISNDKLWRSWGSKLGIPMSDLRNLFDLLAGEDGLVSMKEFLHGIQRVKGPAKALDSVWLLSEFNKLLGVTQSISHAAALNSQKEVDRKRDLKIDYCATEAQI